MRAVTKNPPLRHDAVPAIPGHPDLIAAIAEEIRQFGPIPFDRFMELALYHPQFGYYMRWTEKQDAEQGKERLIGEDRIGWAGDYYTSSDVHPILGQSLAKQIAQLDDLLGRPSPFIIVEMGAGKGRLAGDILTACQQRKDSLFERLRYVIIERSPAMQESQRRLLGPWLHPSARVSWVPTIAELGAEEVVGVLLSNELVDAFPVHRLRVKDACPLEIYVGYDGQRFREELRPISDKLEDYLQRLSKMGVIFREGATVEINLRAAAWIKEISGVLRRGFVITIDYGHTAQDLYGPDRHSGTLLCYYHHLVCDDPYQRVGLQDLTAHVDFSALAAVGEQSDLRVTGFTNQMSFLIGLGAEAAVEQLEPGSPDFQGVVQLLRPDGMGSTFKVLIQHKGLPAPELDGLKYKPFFGSALGAAAKGVNR